MSRGGVAGRRCACAVGGRRARSLALRHRYAVHAALQQVQIHTATVSTFYCILNQVFIWL